MITTAQAGPVKMRGISHWTWARRVPIASWIVPGRSWALQKIGFLIAASLAVAGCAGIEQHNKDLGGKPSPSVAMFAAQSDFAGEACPAVPASLKRREELNKKVFESTLMLYSYMDDATFAGSRAESTAKYRSSWPAMSASKKVAFCNEYYQEISTVTTSMASIDAAALKEYFSPPSQAALDRQATAGLLIAGASIAANAGAVAQVDNSNFDGAARLNSVGGSLSDALPSNSARPGYCPAYGHFTHYAAPAGAAPWTSYVSLRTC